MKSDISKTVFKISTILALFALGAFLTLTGFDTQRKEYFGYKETGEIDYSAILTEGNFLGEQELGPNETYLADLLQNINAEYNYCARFTNPVSGDYSYRFVAVIEANRQDSTKYWSRSYDLTEAKQLSIHDSGKIAISEKISIDYAKYAEILKDFSNEYSKDVSATLSVKMLIEGEFESGIIDRPVTLNSDIVLSAPLTDESIDITVTTNTDNNGKIFTRYVNIETDLHRFCRLAGLLLLAAATYLFAKVVYDRIILHRVRQYEDTLEKIRSEYDSIIVDIEKAPKIAGLNMVIVKDFDELLDVYNSLKLPINYYEKNNEAHFLLINEKLAWKFVLKKEDFIEQKQKTKSHKKHRRTKR